MTIIRVFPRKTSMTPTDAYAFVGDPPLWRPPADEVHVSVTFTWDLREGIRLYEAWKQHYPTVKLGGSAVPVSMSDGINGGEFVAGRYLKHGVTITTRGCVRKCPWCLVPQTEGELRALPIVPGWIVQDNNLLAAPIAHIAKVFRMLGAQNRAVSFPGGLDSRFIDRIIAAELGALNIREVFLATDTEAALEPLKEAVGYLPFLSRRQLRCYVLLGFGNDTIEKATKRLEAVWAIGCLPFAQLFQPPDHHIQYSAQWKALARRWSRPAIMFAMHEGGR